MNESDLPKFDFGLPTPLNSSRDLLEIALQIPENELPHFKFVSKDEAEEPTKTFNWAAAGLDKPKALEGEWTCNTCMLKNGPDRSKCIACETDR